METSPDSTRLWVTDEMTDESPKKPEKQENKSNQISKKKRNKNLEQDGEIFEEYELRNLKNENERIVKNEYSVSNSNQKYKNLNSENIFEELMLEEALAVLNRNTGDFSPGESSTLRLKIGLFGVTMNSDRDYVNVDIVGDDNTVDFFDTRSENNVDNNVKKEVLKGKSRNENSDGNEDNKNNNNSKIYDDGERHEIHGKESDGTYDDSEKTYNGNGNEYKNNTTARNALNHDKNNENHSDDDINNVKNNNNNNGINTDKDNEIDNAINLRIEKVMKEINGKSSKSRTEESNINNASTVFDSNPLLQQMENSPKNNFGERKMDFREGDLFSSENTGEETVVLNGKIKIIECKLEYKTEKLHNVVRNVEKMNNVNLNNSLSTLEIKPSNLYRPKSVIKNSEQKKLTVKNTTFKEIQKVVLAPSPALFGIKGKTKEFSAKKVATPENSNLKQV
jgi:hypothetical protein